MVGQQADACVRRGVSVLSKFQEVFDMPIDDLIKKRFDELQTALAGIGRKAEQGTHESLYPMLICQQWMTSVLSLLQQVFGQDDIHYKKFHEAQASASEGSRVLGSDLSRCTGIFNSARDVYLGGYLIKIRALVEAEVLSDGLEQAEEFLKLNYKDAACIIAGVALETAIKELCTRKGIILSKLDTMNSELARAGVYNKSMQKLITAWAGLRNDGAHGNWGAYTKEQVEQMLAGVNSFIATYI